MNKLTTTVTAMAFASVMAIAGFGMSSASALTTGSSATCTVSTNKASTFVTTSNSVTATFTVKGTGCKVDVTLATWKAPNGTTGMPYSAQKFYAYSTGTFKPGVHTLTTKLPTCFYQVDLVTGNNPTDANGGPGYAKEHRLRRSLHGGTQSCTPTKPATPVTPTTPTTTLVTPTALANTGANAGAIVAIVLGTVVASTVAFRTYLARKNA